MRDYFKGFYRPTKREFQKMWSDGYFVFDTNTLINPFRFQTIAREVILEVLTILRDRSRLWIPHQVGLEYHHNINEEIYIQDSAYKELESSIRDLGTDLENVYKRISLKHSTLILNDQIQGKFNDILDELIQEINTQKEQHPNYEKLSMQIAQIFEGNIGEPYSQEQLNDIYKDGEIRFENLVPPGFKDIDKGDSKRYFDGLHYTKKYGDLVLWKQIIDFAKSKKTDIIFVTDDKKEDWWSISHGKTLGPHPELIQEFRRETGGNNIYIYKTKQFLENCKESKGFPIDSKRIDAAIESINQYKKSVIANEEAIQLEREKEELKLKWLYEDNKPRPFPIRRDTRKSKLKFIHTYEIIATVTPSETEDLNTLTKKIIKAHSDLYNSIPLSFKVIQDLKDNNYNAYMIQLSSFEKISTDLFKELVNNQYIRVLRMTEITDEEVNDSSFEETELNT
ncbi:MULTISPECIES: PIN-like domain-containing protein [Bacillus]|nr:MULTISPECIES: PIN-like domain-containing protein [Bacillus]AQP97316.1 hypothetical protein BZ167_15660 [Bacillus sp. 275]MDV9183542.1 PIN-like domain-containing protein [Bacillus sp. 31]QNQ49129.1 DUF4935 domain-containing protein [Bacillus velezensis]UBQ45479.1 PIN domain-containing protein [Bacillus velezensis]WGS37071.1 PIN-like domain-containing protein [Bacillus velezensis]